MEAIASRDPDAARQVMEALIDHAAGGMKRMHGIDPAMTGGDPRAVLLALLERARQALPRLV